MPKNSTQFKKPIGLSINGIKSVAPVEWSWQ